MLDEFFHLGSFVAMSDSPQKISRQELYEKIWATPIVKLGKELGYSYLEMVQLCEKLNIPRPDGGYWYRRQHGGSEERGTFLDLLERDRRNSMELAEMGRLPPTPIMRSTAPVRWQLRRKEPMQPDHQDWENLHGKI